VGVPASFVVTTDEWYTWDKSPRPNVHVLANVDENSYKPASNIKMGDHPVVWTNEAYKGKNLYIFMGHHPNLFQNPAYVTLLKNAINWAGTPK
jgi:type 1 glutamine amidotransferase